MTRDSDPLRRWQLIIAQNIRKKRKARKQTQAGLAAAAQINIRTLGEVERAECNTTLSVLVQIATALGCGVDDLFGDS
jgi:transcriptional regulator with XRE-family HTH domain